jgi:SAM-dependent methyltransferase
MAWQAYGCAALCALGCTVGLLRVILELNRQIGSARDVVMWCGVPLCAAVVLGLVLPRRVIRRHLNLAPQHPAPYEVAAGESPSPAAAGPLVAFDFAASLTGVLLLVLAVLWATLCGFVEAAENYRALLTQRFVHPLWGTRALLLTPFVVQIALLGAVGAMVLVALHGWHRLLRPRSANVTRVWLVALLASALGGAVGAAMQPAVLDVLTLLCTFGAAALAVVHRPVGTGQNESPWQRSPPAGRLAGPFVVAGVASAGAAVALTVALPSGPLPLRTLATGSMAITAAAALGVVIARAALRIPYATAYGPAAALIVMAALWMLPHLPASSNGLGNSGARAAAISGAATLCVVLVGQKVAHAFGRSPPALAWVGGVVAGGYALGLALAPSLLAPSPRAVGSALPPPDPQRDAIRELLSRYGPSTVFVRGDMAADESTPRAWDVDLGGPQWDIVFVVCGSQGVADARPWESDTADQLVRRCLAALRPGGRLVIELPADELAAAAFRGAARDGRAAADSAYVLDSAGFEGRQAVLLFGRDIPAWIRSLARSDDVDLGLTRVGDMAEVRQRSGDGLPRGNP